MAGVAYTAAIACLSVAYGMTIEAVRDLMAHLAEMEAQDQVAGDDAGDT